MTSTVRATTRVILLLVLGLALSACGWQLRGTTSTPSMETLTVSGASTELRYTLEDELEDQGVLVHSEAPYILVIDDEDWMRRTSAVDAQGRQETMAPSACHSVAGEQQEIRPRLQRADKRDNEEYGEIEQGVGHEELLAVVLTLTSNAI